MPKKVIGVLGAELLNRVENLEITSLSHSSNGISSNVDLGSFVNGNESTKILSFRAGSTFLNSPYQNDSGLPYATVGTDVQIIYLTNNDTGTPEAGSFIWLDESKAFFLGYVTSITPVVIEWKTMLGFVETEINNRQIKIQQFPASESAMLALSVELHEIVIRSDENNALYQLITLPATEINNWIQIGGVNASQVQELSAVVNFIDLSNAGTGYEYLSSEPLTIKLENHSQDKKIYIANKLGATLTFTDSDFVTNAVLYTTDKNDNIILLIDIDNNATNIIKDINFFTIQYNQTENKLIVT